MTDSMMLVELSARLDALDDEDLVDFLGCLEDTRGEHVPNWDVKHAETIAAIQRRPFAQRFPPDHVPITEITSLWAMARYAMWGDLMPVTMETAR